MKNTEQRLFHLLLLSLLWLLALVLDRAFYKVFTPLAWSQSPAISSPSPLTPPVKRASMNLKGINLFTQKNIVIEIDPSTKGLVLAFLSAKCPCSNSHLTELKSLFQDFKNVQFVAFHSNQDEPLDMAVSYFKKAQLPFPVIQDQNLEYANLYKAQKTPHVFLIDKTGDVIYQGGISNSEQFQGADRKYLREALEDLKKGRPIKTPRTRTLGCIISRSHHESKNHHSSESPSE